MATVLRCGIKNVNRPETRSNTKPLQNRQHAILAPSLSVLPIITQHTHTGLATLCPGLLGWAGTRKVKPIWNLLKQETVSGSGIRWAICKSAPCSRQITTSGPHHSVFYRPDALPAAQPTVSKHWRHFIPNTHARLYLTSLTYLFSVL